MERFVTRRALEGRQKRMAQRFTRCIIWSVGLVLTLNACFLACLVFVASWDAAPIAQAARVAFLKGDLDHKDTLIGNATRGVSSRKKRHE